MLLPVIATLLIFPCFSSTVVIIAIKNDYIRSKNVSVVKSVITVLKYITSRFL